MKRGVVTRGAPSELPGEFDEVTGERKIGRGLANEGLELRRRIEAGEIRDKHSIKL